MSHLVVYPATDPRKKAASVLRMAISSPMAPAVSTNRFGFISGEETISAIKAGKGTPITNSAADMGMIT